MDVRTHRANPGDGADDSAGVRAVIAAAQGTAARGVRLPAGACNLNSLVNVCGVDVCGTGFWHTVLNGANRRGGFAITGPGTTINNVRINGTGGATDAFTDDTGVKGTGSQGMANDENRYAVQRGTGNTGWQKPIETRSGG